MSILEEIAILNNSKAGNFDDEGMEIYVAENTEVDDSENGDELSIHALEGDLAMENQGGVDNQEEFVRRDDLEIITAGIFCEWGREPLVQRMSGICQ